MNSRNAYWSLYTELKHYERYYSHLKTRSIRLDKTISFFCALVSTGSVAAWAIWDVYPYAWATIVAIAQVVILFKQHFLPFTLQLSSLTFLLPQLELLLIDIEDDWLSIEDLPDDVLRRKIKKYRERYAEIDHTFAKITDFPDSKRIARKAKSDCINYFFHRYNV